MLSPEVGPQNRRPVHEIPRYVTPPAGSECVHVTPSRVNAMIPFDIARPPAASEVVAQNVAPLHATPRNQASFRGYVSACTVHVAPSAGAVAATLMPHARNRPSPNATCR